MFLSKKIKTLIGYDKLNKFNLIVIFIIFIALIETAGIGMVIPLVNVILNPDYLNKINKGLSLEQNINELELIDKDISECEYMAGNWKPSVSEADQ